MIRVQAFLVSLLVSVAARDATAVTTKAWTSSSYKDFEEGEADGALVSSAGEVVPGFLTRRAAVETEALFSVVRSADGTLYAGGITDGTVWATTGEKVRKVAKLEDDAWIGALAIGQAGTIYAGTVGTGAIYAIDAASGKARKVVTLEGAEHVWALLWDGKALWAGTGSEGALFKVDVAASRAVKVWTGGATHILALMRSRDGALWLGTADEAILYRFDPQTQAARAVADFAGTEVKAIVEVDGAVVVAANEFENKAATSGAPAAAPEKGSKGTPAKPPEGGSTPGAAGSTKEPSPARQGERKGKGGLFRVELDGRIEQLHAVAEGYFTSLCAVGSDVFAASGTQGRVYQVKPDHTVAVAFDVEERQVNALVATNDGLAFVAGDSAAFYVSDGPAQDARYTSKVFDAQVSSRWGKLHWRGDAALEVETRSGATANPDRGWTGWQSLAASDRTGGDGSAGRIVSPPGRYLQYRIGFKNGVGLLRQVTVYYLPQNQRARVVEITVGSGEDASSKWVTTQGGAAKPRSPVVKVKWKVDNPDSDELVYVVELRPEGEAEWRRVTTGPENLTKPELEWNTEALPDGTYRLRVTASDPTVNPPELVRQHELVSPPFLIDNQKPQVLDVNVNYPFVSLRAVDSFSRIEELAYSLDGGDWLISFPNDALYDSVAEVFTIKLSATLARGNHSLAIRAADEADNIGAAAVTFKVK